MYNVYFYSQCLSIIVFKVYFFFFPSLFLASCTLACPSLCFSGCHFQSLLPTLPPFNSFWIIHSRIAPSFSLSTPLFSVCVFPRSVSRSSLFLVSQFTLLLHCSLSLSPSSLYAPPHSPPLYHPSVSFSLALRISLLLPLSLFVAHLV